MMMIIIIMKVSRSFKLGLSNTALSNVTARAFAAARPICINRLILSGNGMISAEGGRALLDVAAASASLQELDLRHTGSRKKKKKIYHHTFISPHAYLQRFFQRSSRKLPKCCGHVSQVHLERLQHLPRSPTVRLKFLLIARLEELASPVRRSILHARSLPWSRKACFLLCLFRLVRDNY